MTDQIPLFVEDINEALRATVQSIGGLKKIGVELRPEMPADQAGRWLSDCMNPDRRDKLCPEQVCWIRREARKKNVHILAYFEAQDAGYTEPRPINPEDEKTKIQRQVLEATEWLKKSIRQLEVLSS